VDREKRKKWKGGRCGTLSASVWSSVEDMWAHLTHCPFSHIDDDAKWHQMAMATPWLAAWILLSLAWLQLLQELQLFPFSYTPHSLFFQPSSHGSSLSSVCVCVLLSQLFHVMLPLFRGFLAALAFHFDSLRAKNATASSLSFHPAVSLSLSLSLSCLFRFALGW